MSANGKAARVEEIPEAAITGIVRPGEVTVSAIQAGVEGVPVNVEGVIPFAGQLFRLAPKIGLMPLLKFAHSAASGATEDDMEGMAAMYAMIRDCIHGGCPCTCGSKTGKHEPGCEYDAGDWDRFERVAIDTRAEGEELMEVVGAALEATAARPTQPPSASSPRELTSSQKSKRRSSPRGSVVPPEAEGLVPVAELLLSKN